MMPDGIEFQNIVTQYIPDNGTVFVSKYDWKWSLNVKPTPIKEKYYVFSRHKLSIDEMIAYISMYIEKENEQIPR